jgi:hypothetical protein
VRGVGLIVLAAAMTFTAVADGVAQPRGGFAGGLTRGPIGPTVRMPDGPRGPGFGPRIPGGTMMVPPGLGPRTPMVIDITDEPRRRVTISKQIKQIKQAKQQQKQQQQKQLAQRTGFAPPPAGEQRFMANDVLVSIASSVSAMTLDAMARQHRLTPMESREFALTRRRLSRWRINDGRPVANVIRTLMADARILGAQPNYLYALQEGTPAATTPDQAAYSAQYALAKLRLPQAHAMSKGESVVVAIIDTTVDAAHPELAGVIAATFDATGTAEKPQPHGTAMAGAIAAHGKLMGSAPGVKLLSIQAFGSVRPEGKSDGTSFGILKGLDWAAKENANIVNMSFAGPADPEMQTMLAAASAKGIVLVAAAGNAGPRSRALYPAADPNVIAVTATDMDDRLFVRANRGPHIAVAAPGVDILVAGPEGGYQTTSGTSVAAAEVSGIVALMLERDRKLDPAAVRRLLTATARDLGPAGPDDQFGAGLTDAYAALTALGARATDVSRANGTMP